MTHTPILDANGDEAEPSRSWFRQQLTLPNLVLACSIAFGVGGYIKAFDALEKRVADVETAMRDTASETAATYSRRDVQDALLISINQRLQNIEGDLKDLKSRR
jgi:hypothetical protein